MKKTNLVIAIVILFIICVIGGCASRTDKERLASARLSIGTEYLRAHQHTLALKTLLEAERLNPRDPEIHYYLGMAYDKKEVVDKAIAEFKEAVKIAPDYSEAHNYLGTIYLKTGNWDEAIGEFNKALSNVLYATPAAALYNMGRAYHEKGDYQSALSRYTEAKKKEPNTVYLPLIEMYTGIIYFNLGETGKATEHLRRSVEIYPLYVESHYWLGKSYAKQKNLKEAKKEFLTVIKMAPRSELGDKARESLKAIEGGRQLRVE